MTGAITENNKQPTEGERARCYVCEQALQGKQTKYCSTSCKAKSTNNAFQNYEAQRKRGRDRKMALIQAKGSRCEVCGYNRNASALCFHHRNPPEKLFQLDLRDLSNRTWESLLSEAEKCILLCQNCHAELHHPDMNLNALTPP